MLTCVSVSRLQYFRRPVRFMPSCMRRRRCPTACLSASRRLRGAPSSTRPTRRTDSSAGRSTRTTIVDRTFRTHVLENRYLKVTLVPEFGGRILSIIYKPTGHEQLYRTEVGVPYGIKGGTFLLRLADGVWRHLPHVPGSRARQDVAEAVGFQGGEGECRRSDGVDVAQGRFRVFRGTEAVRRGSTGIEATYYVTLKADRAALDARMVLKNPQRQDDPIRVLDLHDAGAGIGPEKSQNHRRRRNHRADPGLQHAPLVGQSVRRRRELGSGQEPFRKTALLQELADDGHRLRGARYAGREFLGRDQPRQRRGDHPHRRQHGHAGLENVDVGISVVHERNRRAQGPERSSGLTSNCGRACRTSFSTARAFPHGAKCRFRKPTARPSA